MLESALDELYPRLSDETTNINAAEAAGFEIFFTDRLPQKAWLEGYYEPLECRMRALEPNASLATREVLRETRSEIAWFKEADSSLGYTFHGLRAA